MRLVIDPQQITQVTMVCGPVELPLSREQVVQMLFGDDYELVRTGKAKKSVKTSAGRTRASSASSKRERSDAAREVTLAHLQKVKRASLDEIRSVVEKRAPGFLAGRSKSYLSGVLLHLEKVAAVKRTGTKGSFLFSIGKNKPAAGISSKTIATTVAKKIAMRDERRERLQKKMANQLKKGLCTRCDNKRVKGKKVCRTHYKQILTVQKAMTETRRAASKAKAKTNGVHVNGLNGRTSVRTTNSHASL